MRKIKATEYWTVTLSFQYSLVPGDQVKSIRWFHLADPRRELKTSDGKGLTCQLGDPSDISSFKCHDDCIVLTSYQTTRVSVMSSHLKNF